MSKKRKRNGPPPADDPKEMGEFWRGQMRADLENLVGLVWKRVHRVHGIDLADRRQASSMQVYRVLVEVVTLCGAAPGPDEDPGINVSAQELEAFVDGVVPRVFRNKR